MPKKKHRETPEEQAARFEAAVREMIAAGELSPTEADASMERAMQGVARLREGWFEGESDPENPT